MGNLLNELYGDQINNFLKTLSRNGVRRPWVERFRKDAEFARESARIMMDYYLKSLTKYTVEVDPTESIPKLNRRFIESRPALSLQDNILAKLEPKPKFGPRSEKYCLGIFIFPIFYRATEKEVIDILDSFGLESVNTEEALSFAVQKGINGNTSIFVLSSRLIKKSTKLFLNLGVTMAGYESISLWVHENNKEFMSPSYFMVKKK